MFLAFIMLNMRRGLYKDNPLNCRKFERFQGKFKIRTIHRRLSIQTLLFGLETALNARNTLLEGHYSLVDIFGDHGRGNLGTF